MQVLCFLCHKCFLTNDDLKAHCKDDHGAEQDVDLLILLQHMTQTEKFSLRKQLERKIATPNDKREPELDDVASKITFWKQVHGLSDLKRDEKNDTIDMFDEILRENYDDILSESVDEKFNLLLESNQDVTQELTITVTPVPKKKRYSKNPSSSSKRGVQWWRFFDFELCITSWTL